MTDIGANITWTRKLEQYFSSTGERANCMAWSHTQAGKIYAFKTTLIDLPVIVLSSVTGFLSVGSGTLFAGSGSSASSALGAVSLFVAVLNTMGTYFSWAKRAEAHRIASIHFAKLYRFISVEMSLPREERTTPSEFLKYTKEQYDHLTEMSPALPEEVIKSFHAMFKNDLKDISVPEQMNGLEAIHVYDDSDLRNDLELEMKTKTLEIQHSNNIENMPGLVGFKDGFKESFRRDSVMTSVPMPPLPKKKPVKDELPVAVPAIAVPASIVPSINTINVPGSVVANASSVPDDLPINVPTLDETEVTKVSSAPELVSILEELPESKTVDLPPSRPDSPIEDTIEGTEEIEKPKPFDQISMD